MIAAALDWLNPAQARRHWLAMHKDGTKDLDQYPAADRQITIEHGLSHPSAVAQLGVREHSLHTEWTHLRLVADARIDNRKELWEHLKGAPYLRENSSDGDLILAAYARWGTHCAEHLIGDFAFVLFDERHQQLFAACDGMNMRPLHYVATQNGVCLATNAEQLLRLPSVTQDLNELALGLWISGYPDPCLPMFKDVQRLRPGHCLIATRESLEVAPYWDLEPSDNIRYTDEREYADHLEALLSRAVKDRLHGAGSATAMQMSGGMDSTSVAAMACRHARGQALQPVAISHRYQQGSHQDESITIESVRDHIGLTQHRYVEAHTHLGLPFADLYPPHIESPGTLLSPRYGDDMQIARDAGASVLLTGSGGDEMCWGHSRSYSKRLNRGDLSVLSEVIRGVKEQNLPLARTLRDLFITPLAPTALVDAARAIKGRGKSNSWLSDDASERLGFDAHITEHSAPATIGDPVFSARYNALRWSSTIHSVRSHAAVGREFGVDVRHPFFDRRIAEFSFAIPDDLWLRDGQPKWLLRQAMAGSLPNELLDARHKVIFDGFFLQLLQRNHVEVRNLLSHASLYDLGIANRDALIKQFDAVIANKHPLNVELLYAVQLQNWLSMHAI
ncbi:asparagine synthase-related protein [Congregibacter variabilis]|uniref:asparagine synthase (glutamine-hydrolyzing) n=1 Tax=Congregibacter variabilis TaxID=3081200 RepID=A0ABZ0I881_9GAMM|nr:asparagine synthase-related protein [Congregibacter sp. IMCC43200]